MIKIVSDGTALGTKVYAKDGTKLSGITRIDLLPIEPGNPVCARLMFAVVKFDVVADDGAVLSTIDVTHFDSAVPN